MFFQILFLALVFFEGSLGQCPVGKIMEFGVLSLDQNKTIDRHNYWRTQIAQGLVANQPKGANLLKTKWDSAISKPAQNLTDTCVFGHVWTKDSRWMNVGQNIFKWSGTAWKPGANWTQAIDSWFGEVKDFTYPNITVTGKVTGHYTQVVWANTWAIGCGYTAWYDNTTKWYSKLYACNYGPGGNYWGQVPYKTGAGCENLCNPP